MPAPLVVAVTVNWNRPADTLECLQSLARQDYPNLRPLVVDNGSQDGAAEQLQAAYPQAEYILHPQNLGFAGGYNLGMRWALQSGAEYVLIINNDATLAPDGLTSLMAQARPEDGALAPLIFYSGAPAIIWASYGIVNRWNMEKTDPWKDSSGPAKWHPAVECSFLTGCVLLFPRSTLETVGMFDERFHMYYEDSDLCARLRAAGRRLALAPSAHAWHKIAASSGGGDSPNERYWMARSSVQFFVKHTHGLAWTGVIPWRMGSAMHTSLRLLLSRRTDALGAYWRGLRDGLRGTTR